MEDHREDPSLRLWSWPHHPLLGSTSANDQSSPVGGRDLPHPVWSHPSTFSQPELGPWLPAGLFLLCSHSHLAPCSPAEHTGSRPHPNTTGNFFSLLFNYFFLFAHMWYMRGHTHMQVYVPVCDCVQAQVCVCVSKG